MTNAADSAADSVTDSATDSSVIVRWVEARVNEQRGPHAAVGPDTELLRDAMLDSLDLADLVIHLEDHAGLTIPPVDINAQNFRTPATIAALLDRIRQGAAGT